MDDSDCVVALFVPSSSDPPTIDALAALAGVCSLQSTALGWVGGWGGTEVRMRVTRLAMHDLVLLCLTQRSFYRHWEDHRSGAATVGGDPALPLVEAFVRACCALSVEVGMFVTDPHKATSEWVVDRYADVLGKNEGALCEERTGLLYLDSDMSRGWVPPAARDIVALAGGFAVFAGRGADRWFAEPVRESTGNAGSLRLVALDGEGLIIVPAREVVTIGRMPNCDVVIADPTIARKHGILRHQGGTWFIEDAASTCGVFANDTAVRGRIALHDGDEVRLGRLRWKVRSG